VMDDDTTWIRFEHGRTTLVVANVPEVVLPVGAGAIAQALFRHEPPAAGELERAIDEVEDALAASGLGQAERGWLRTAEPRLFERLGLPAASGRATRDEVEAQFQRLASIALGHPAPAGAPVPGGEDAARLLILRECLHHLGFAGLLCASAAGRRPTAGCVMTTGAIPF